MKLYFISDKFGVAQVYLDEQKALEAFKKLVDTFEQTCSSNPNFRKNFTEMKIDENQSVKKYSATYVSPFQQKLVNVTLLYHAINI